MVILKNAFLLVVVIVNASKCARILGIASVPTLSHNIFFRPIWKALADRGHELTVLTTNAMEESYPNIREIDLNFVYERKAQVGNLTWKFHNWPKILSTYEKMFTDIVALELNHPEVRSLLENETEHFDLVIAEMHIPVMFGFAHRFKCPLIGISSTDILTEHHALLGNPTHPILFPDAFLPFADDSFLNRLVGVVFRLLREIRRASFRSNSIDILKTHFGPDTPPIEDLMKNINLVFINTHPAFNFRPLGPKFVTIGGGSHIQISKELPKNLKQLMDNSAQGVVYFSLGTNVKTTQYPSNFINATIEAFRELPYQIIWKCDYDVLPNLPGNVKVFKWVPQQDVLRHKNMKVFITQGGIHSMEEAVNMEVPMIGIPFMSDQNRNVYDLVKRGFGVSLERDTMTKDDLKRAINEVVSNSKYKNKVSKTAKLLKDQPMRGLEKAIWYTEFAIRNKDAHEVYNNPNLNIRWYQYLLLDVIGILLLASIAIGYLFHMVFGMAFLILKRLIKSLLKSKIE